MKGLRLQLSFTAFARRVVGAPPVGPTDCALIDGIDFLVDGVDFLINCVHSFFVDGADSLVDGADFLVDG
jgi:hypothetical protein